jgi:hypothetical protein
VTPAARLPVVYDGLRRLAAASLTRRADGPFRTPRSEVAQRRPRRSRQRLDIRSGFDPSACPLWDRC